MADDEFDGSSNDSVDGAADDGTALGTMGDGGIQENGGGSRTLEGVLRALINQRRRYTLYFMQDNEVSDLDELAAHVAAMEQDTDPEVVNTEQADQVRTSLLHSDLPMLEDVALVEFDRRSEAVRYSQPPDLLETLLRLCATFDAPPDQSN
ncbi:DUF7344 domain-containing protein [Halomontanus rarus]|uniref:DUF7344 domain-containing protein n=1 Tax=Halomontanus rarus TaxID=3034020 RepID=UPI001F612CCA